ncbi:type II toxin-antitoxin system MqsA family antitoxin [Myxococcota bacterium]
MGTAKKAITCHGCGERMARGKKKVTFEYKTESIRVDQPGWYCKCGEAVVSGGDAKATELAFAVLRSRVEGVLSPQRVAQIRKGLRLSQRRASKILGGGPRAFQKYESGTAIVSRAMSNLLLLLEKEPSRLKEILDKRQEAA